MIRIWAKIVKKGKIISQYTFEKDGAIDYAEFFDYLRDICEHLDISTPVLIKQHLFSFAKYNTVKFVQADFLEPISFDRLVLENIFI